MTEVETTLEHSSLNTIREETDIFVTSGEFPDISSPEVTDMRPKIIVSPVADCGGSAVATPKIKPRA
ncbi:MAG: hypothetical protein H6619_04170 [Deltaproteobacteria bacterium]|nr:hypothetical protein [Deltaproteobacteria bacterium]